MAMVYSKYTVEGTLIMQYSQDLDGLARYVAAHIYSMCKHLNPQVLRVFRRRKSFNWNVCLTKNTLTFVSRPVRGKRFVVAVQYVCERQTMRYCFVGKNFVVRLSTTKTTKKFTPPKIPAIRYRFPPKLYSFHRYEY